MLPQTSSIANLSFSSFRMKTQEVRKSICFQGGPCSEAQVKEDKGAERTAEDQPKAQKTTKGEGTAKKGAKAKAFPKPLCVLEESSKR
jgi:hypothetical protein